MTPDVTIFCCAARTLIPSVTCVSHALLSISCLPDEAAAEDKVTFTPGKKPSKLETLMTKEEVEEEQRSVD